MLVLLLALAQQTYEPFPPTPFDRVIPAAIDAQDKLIEAHGRGESFEVRSEFSGSLHLWPKSAGDLDLFLRVETPEGELLGEDDNSGGGTTPYLRLEVEPGRALVVIIAVAQGEAVGQFELCAIAAPETDETRSASEEGKLAIAEVKRLRDAGDLDAGRARAQEVLDRLVAIPGGRSSELVAARMWSLGYQAYGLSALRSTQSAWTHLLQHWLRTLPDEHSSLQAARGNLASTIRDLGDLAGASALQEQVLAISVRTLPEEHPGLQTARNNLALTLRDLGNLEAARALQERVLAIRTREFPDEHADLQVARANLALTIRDLGDLAGARALQEKVLAIRARTLPDEDPQVQTSLGNLAATIAVLGDLAAARALQERVLAICTRTLPDEHPDLQKARANLATTITRLGDLAGARALEETVLAVFTRTLPDEHPDLQRARSNLAGNLSAQGDLTSACALYEQVLEVYTRTLPDEHPDLQTARNNVAGTIKDLGDLAGARALFEQVLAACTRTLPDHHPDVQRARGNLALTMKSQGDLAGAGELEEHVLEVRTRTLPNEHPDLQQARRNLAWTLGKDASRRASGAKEEGGEREKARETCTRLLCDAATGHQAAFAIALGSGSPREVEEASATSLKALDQTLSFAVGYGALSALREVEFAAFALSETTRGAAVRSASWQRLAGASMVADSLRARVRNATDRLAGLARSGGERDAFQVARAERDAAQRELAALAREVRGEVLERPVTVEAVAGVLGRDAAVVAFRFFTRYDVKFGSADAEHPSPSEDARESLCAFVVRPPVEAGSSALTTVDLGPLAAIEREVMAWRAGFGAVRGRGLASAGVDTTVPSTSSPSARGLALRRLLLDPLAAALGDAKRIVVVLDDVTNLVPLDALPLDDGGLVGDRVRVEVRSSLAELLDPRGRSEQRGIALTLGDARFDAPPQEYSEQPTSAESDSEAEPRAAQMAGLLRGSVWDSGFTALAQTGPEARGVAELWNQLAEPDRESIVLSGAAASRSSLTQLAPRARWLHIATHGWHAPDSVKSFEDVAREASDGVSALRASSQDVVKGMSPMLLCGLALAGANLPEDAVGRAPGLFTAEEMSALDLSNCELAVLSACDTNVGIRKAGQGVASFQRALQMAGARSVITSLWKVPDEATRELMLDFYRRIWVLKQPKWQALWEAKMALRHAKDERGAPLYTTRDWAAWVLSGDPD